MPIYKAGITGGKRFGTLNHFSLKNLLLMQYSMFMLAIYATYCSVNVNPTLLIYPSLPHFPFGNYRFAFDICKSVSFKKN